MDLAAATAAAAERGAGLQAAEERESLLAERIEALEANLSAPYYWNSLVFIFNNYHLLLNDKPHSF